MPKIRNKKTGKVVTIEQKKKRDKIERLKKFKQGQKYNV